MGDEGDLVASRLARGCRCFVVWIDGAVGGYGWLSTNPEWIGELQLEIGPRPGEGYVWNCVTVEEHRRRGVFRSLVLGISEVAREAGLRRLWIGSVAIPAERALEPSGFRPALRFDSMTTGGLHLMRVVETGDRVLAAEGLAVLRVGGGIKVRRSRRRRH